MRSIRLSLIIYFLVLLTAALAAVSWLSYSMAADSLRQRQRASESRIQAEFAARSDDLRANLDRHLLRQAQLMVNQSKSAIIHGENYFGAFGLIGSPAMPLGYLNYTMFAYEMCHPQMAPAIFFSQPLSTHVEDGDKIMPEEGSHAQEYFQIYRANGHVVQRSESMEDDYFSLSRTALEKPTPVTAAANATPIVVTSENHGLATGQSVTIVGVGGITNANGIWTVTVIDDNQFSLKGSVGNGTYTGGGTWTANYALAPLYDDVVMSDGDRVRRVTLKANVSGYDVIMLGWPFKGLTQPTFFPKGPSFSPKTQPKGSGKNAKGPAPRPPVPPVRMPAIYVQYGSDLGPTEAKIAELARNRDERLAELGVAIESELKELRSRMIWIGLAALAALWLGGYLMIRLGLAPLSKMSEAVSKVSPKNFHLPLETARLPDELQPIAARLVEMLGLLQKAFAREKQAAADISHELRTPLSALLTTLEVGLKKTRSPDEYREILDECRASGQHMYQLVERLLTLARLDAGVDHYRPVDTDVTEVALACADLIRPLARARGLDLRLHLPDPVTTETDPNKLREIITNLLHNAVEYNKDNGSIELTVERAQGRVRIEVRDTGIGIKPEQMEHLFERFYRADPSRHADTPHAGLGLAIVKTYVDLLGGTIKVESSEAGSTFTVELPYAASIHDVDTAVQAALVRA